MIKSMIRLCQPSNIPIIDLTENIPRAAVSGNRLRTHAIMERMVSGDSQSYTVVQKDFEDRRRVSFRSGKGGDPAPNTVRGQKKNGPAFGGNGGSIILKASAKVESLADLPEEDTIAADPGADGAGYSRGIHARDRVVEVPLGTIVRERVKTDKKTPEGRTIFAPRFLYQFLNDRDSIILCEGGKGGIAPRTFKKADGRKGAQGEKKSIDLEVRLVNDCALIGLPNSGKTSIISSLTSSLTRIGPEPYSTTRPHIGTLQFKDGLSVKLVDLPGIAEGGACDKSNGIRVLRHTWRSKLWIYCVDISSMDPFGDLEVLRGELKAYNGERPELVVATKCDLLHKDSLLNLDSLFFKIRSQIGEEIPVVGTSARFGLGINRLVHQIRQQLFPNQILHARPRVPAEVVDNSQFHKLR